MPLSTRLAHSENMKLVIHSWFNDKIIFFKNLPGKANMVFDASSTLLVYCFICFFIIKAALSLISFF